MDQAAAVNKGKPRDKQKSDTIVCKNTKGWEMCRDRCHGCRACHDVIVKGRTKTGCLKGPDCLTDAQRAEVRAEVRAAHPPPLAQSTGGMASHQTIVSFFAQSTLSAPVAQVALEIGSVTSSAQAEEPSAGSGSDEVTITGAQGPDDDLFNSSGDEVEAHDEGAAAELGAVHAPVGAAPVNPPASSAESPTASQPQQVELQLEPLAAQPHQPELQASADASPPTSPRSGGPPPVVPMQILQGGPMHWAQGSGALSLSLMKRLVNSPQRLSPRDQVLLAALVRSYAERPEYEDAIDRHVQELLTRRGECNTSLALPEALVAGSMKQALRHAHFRACLHGLGAADCIDTELAHYTFPEVELEVAEVCCCYTY